MVLPAGLHLRVEEGPHTFLLASDEAVCVERRNRMQLNVRPTEPVIVAWLLLEVEQRPAVRLSHVLGFEAREWNEAVYLKGPQGALGLAAQSIRLVDAPCTPRIKPFTAVGDRCGSEPLYSGVWINGDESTLVLNGRGLLSLAAAAIGR